MVSNQTDEGIGFRNPFFVEPHGVKRRHVSALQRQLYIGRKCMHPMLGFAHGPIDCCKRHGRGERSYQRREQQDGAGKLADTVVSTTVTFCPAIEPAERAPAGNIHAARSLGDAAARSARRQPGAPQVRSDA